MRLHRFYIDQQLEKGKDIRIENAELLHQWTKVFRLTSSDRAILFNGSGMEYEGYFKVLSKKEAIIFLDKEEKVANVLKTELHVFQAVIKKDNFELVVQKCTEIGAAAFHPIITERSEKKDLNMMRLKKIAAEASEQSGRGSLPEIFEPEDLQTAIKDFDGEIYLLDLDGKKLPNIFKSKKIGIFIGPEGGWSENERDFFENTKIKSFSFGEQVLRAETAAIAASALILLN